MIALIPLIVFAGLQKFSKTSEVYDCNLRNQRNHLIRH